VRTGYWCNSEGSVSPDPVRLHTQHVLSAYWIAPDIGTYHWLPVGFGSRGCSSYSSWRAT